MKYSNIPWVGIIPKNWSICRFKDVSLLYNGNSIKDEEKDNYTNPNNAYPYIATKDIDVTYQSVNYNNGLYTKKYDSAFKIACADSSLMCIEGGSAGKKKAYLQHDVSFVNKLCCFMPKRIYGKYLFYYICSPNFEIEFNKFITGLIGGVSISTIKNFDILLPPEIEQQKIASFLDRKCAEIDEMITLQEKIVEELKSYKQSVITEAVTKGLNPDVPMKDSEIEWIGEIPEHWNLHRLKYLCSIQTGDKDTQDAVQDGQYPFYVRSPHVEKSNNYSFEGEGILMAGDGAGAGRVFHHVYGKYAVHQRVYRLYDIQNAIQSDYLFYYVSNLFCKVMDMGSAQSTVPSVRLPMLTNFATCIPPMEEQNAIAEYLKTRCTEIDNLISIKLSKIDSLKEYKKSIIYEYVTGKKEVI